MIKRCLILSLIFTFFFCLAFLAMGGAQINKTESAPENSDQEMQWVWGEIIALDPVKKELVIKYLDYDTDQDKELTMSIDQETTFENVASLEEIKPPSPAGVDYIVNSAINKNIARNISIENPELLKSEGKLSEQGAQANLGVLDATADKAAAPGPAAEAQPAKNSN